MNVMMEHHARTTPVRPSSPRGAAVAVLVALVVMLVLIGAVAVSYARPCATEDSARCTWYGSSQGNGQGATYTALTGDSLIYW